MADNVKVSVIITTYGKPTKLKRAIDSIINQTYPNIELIVVDDNGFGSLNGIETEAIISNFSDKNNIFYIKHDKNKNGAAARNTGIGKSTGEYIAFLDDDDIYLPQRIEKSMDFMKKNSSIDGVCVGVAYAQYGNIKGTMQKKNNLCLTPKMLFLDQMSIGTGSNIFLKKSAVLKEKGFDESFNRYQDLEFMIRVASHHHIVYSDEILVIKDVGDSRILQYEKVKEAFLFFNSKFKYELKILNPVEEKRYNVDRWNSLYSIAIQNNNKVNIEESKAKLKFFLSDSIGKYYKIIIVRKVGKICKSYVPFVKRIKERLVVVKCQLKIGIKQYKLLKKFLLF